MRKDKLLDAEKGIRVFFGKRYIWLLNSEGTLELHKLGDEKESA